jgi:hypothetical protein
MRGRSLLYKVKRMIQIVLFISCILAIPVMDDGIGMALQLKHTPLSGKDQDLTALAGKKVKTMNLAVDPTSSRMNQDLGKGMEGKLNLDPISSQTTAPIQELKVQPTLAKSKSIGDQRDKAFSDLFGGAQPQINHQFGNERSDGKFMGLGLGSEVVPRLGAMGAGLPVPTGSSNGLAGGGIEWTCAGIAKTDFGWKCTEYGRPK